jgi:dTDP-4-dehydrorhamnose 3,5-epimerase
MNKENLKKEDIGEEYRDLLTTQDYSKKETIDGIKIVELKQFSDDSGSFNEVARLNSGLLEDFPDFEPKQVSYSLMEPGTVKAFHLHLKQEDLWFTPPGDKLIIGLVDLRSNSKTYKIEQKVILGGGRALLIYIPRGVAHGAANLTNKSSQIFYFVSEQFNPEDPDEKRLPWDFLGKDYWEKQPG